MAITLPPGRSVDAVAASAGPSPGRSPAGTRFAQAVAQVARIQRPLSPALASASDPHAMARLVSSVQESKARLDSLQTRMRRTGDASIAPLIAQQMQELDYRSSLVAKALGKVGSTIKEVATAA